MILVLVNGDFVGENFRLFALMEDLALVNGDFIGDILCLFALVEDFSGLIGLTRTGVGVLVCCVRTNILSLVPCKSTSFLLRHFGLLRDKLGFALNRILSLK